MRADRELDLLKDLVKTEQYEYLGRWYGIEVDFPPALDNIFDVTNNKQTATKIRPISPELLMSMLDTAEFSDEEIESLSGNAHAISSARLQEILDKLQEADPEAYFLYTVLDSIQYEAKKVSKINQDLKFEGTAISSKKQQASPNSGVETRATKVTTALDQKYGGEPQQPTATPEDIRTLLDGTGNYPTPEAAQSRVDEIISNKIQVIIEDVELRPDALFDVSNKEGLTLLAINKRHPFYQKLIANSTPEQNEALKLSLAAWAKMENDAKSHVAERLEIARDDWGQSLYEFLSDDE